MYDDLVKTLRETDFSYGCPCGAEPLCKDKDCIIIQAADAIEELRQIASHYEEESKGWWLAACDAKEKIENLQADVDYLERQVPRWIPVTERLPEAEKKRYWVCTDTEYQCECRWTNNRFGMGVFDKWGWSIFDIPQYSHVVAWMPLPEPPKGEREDDE